MRTAYVDTAIDLAGRRWYVNDRVLHTIPGVRSDVGRITELYAGAVVRCRVTFDDGASAPIYFSELALVGRRTLDDAPFAAAESGAVVYCERCQLATHAGEFCPRRTN
jgi:hypothetical protein